MIVDLVGDHLDELRDRRDVQRLHGLLHLPRHQSRHARDGPDPRREVQTGVADGGDLHPVHRLGADGVHAEEGEENVVAMGLLAVRFAISWGEATISMISSA